MSLYTKTFASALNAKYKVHLTFNVLLAPKPLNQQTFISLIRIANTDLWPWKLQCEGYVLVSWLVETTLSFFEKFEYFNSERNIS